MKDDDATLYELTEKYPDEESAIRYFEAMRWPKGATCPACASKEVGRGTQTMRRRQLWYCAACGAMFSVTSGTVMEHTKLPLRKWLLAFHLMGASKKGMSALQLSRMLQVTYKTAWHLSHRIRATMAEEPERFTGTVETDETYLGGKRKGRGRGYRGDKIAVQTIVKRRGKAKTIALNGSDVDGRAVAAKLRKHTSFGKTVLMTDESPIYDAVGEHFKDHHTVNHSAEEYVRREGKLLITTNAAEGLFANLKRQIHGTHHHTSRKHLPRYLEEYDYKYNTRGKSDGARTRGAIKKIEGRKLTLYKSVHGGPSLFDRRPGEEPQAPEGEAFDGSDE